MARPNCAARAPLDAHDVGARVAEVHREEVLLDVGDAIPQLELAVAVEEGAGRLHGERLDARPQVRRVAHALARHPLDVDHEHAARGERVRVAAALERHVDHLVGQQHRRVRAQLLLRLAAQQRELLLAAALLLRDRLLDDCQCRVNCLLYVATVFRHDRWLQRVNHTYYCIGIFRERRHDVSATGVDNQSRVAFLPRREDVDQFEPSPN